MLSFSAILYDAFLQPPLTLGYLDADNYSAPRHALGPHDAVAAQPHLQHTRLTAAR